MTSRDRFELLLLAVIWGASFLFMRVAAPEFGPIALVGIRVGVAALFLIVVLAWRGGLRGMLAVSKPLTVLGAISSALPFTLFAYATLYVTAGVAAVLNATAPLFGALVGYFWLRDKLAPARVLGLIVGFGGVIVLFWGGIPLEVGGATWAMIAGLVASLSYGVSVNYTKRRLSGVPPLVTATGSQISATLLLLPLCAMRWPSVMPPLRSWLCVIGLGIVCTGIANIIFFRLISHVGPAKAITVTYLIPVSGMLWGLVFLHEPITVGMVIACAVILLGTALATGGLPLRARPSAPGAAMDA
jgi:drug/metabolite transporter (DMT)-like permease